jgi:prevent-host-death family protein
METINMHEAKTHLSKIIDRVAKGETVLIGKAGVPLAVLSPYRPHRVSRKPGSMKGRIWIADDFDTVDETITDEFLESE